MCRKSRDVHDLLERHCQVDEASPLSLPRPLTPGATLGPYEIQAPLGAGGMGEVYRTRDTRLGRSVAIKVLPEHVASDPDLQQRFEREAKTISSLNHPYICGSIRVSQRDFGAFRGFAWVI